MNTETAIETSTGRYVDLLAPDPETIVLADIAAHLSRIGRFNGACSRYYSVAEHVLLAADRLRSQGHGAAMILLGLHHDSHEAYFGDLTRPMKIAMGEAFDTGPGHWIERQLQSAVHVALGLPDWTDENRRDVKAADNWALAAEAWHLLPSRGIGWVTQGLYDETDSRNPPRDAGLLPGCGMSPAVAERLFIAQHNRWTGILADMRAARP
jgi:hypothetical protein